MSRDEITAERVARNNAIFRDANEGISEAADAYSVDGVLPFICECPEPRCVEIIMVEHSDYQAVRAVSTRFINAPGHHVAAQGWSTPVEHRDGYEIVEKVGLAAELVEDMNTPAE